VTKFFFRKRPERRTLAVRRETKQVIWQRANNNGGVGTGGPGSGSNSVHEGMVDIREIKLIRQGKVSKDFDKWSDDAKRHDSSKCFVM
jgi:phosphatidylinositol phospholipase C gamma-1